MTLPSGTVWPGLIILAVLAGGCNRALSPSDYLKAYEARAKVERVAGDYRITTLLMEPQYLLAKQGDTTWSTETRSRFEKTYSAAHYVSVQVALAEPTGGPDDMRKDILGQSMIEGQEAYQRRLALLEREIGAYVRLGLENGEEIAPVSARFQRGYALAGPHQFLFLFPKRHDGRPVDIRGGRIVMRDFGLNTGTLRIPLAQAGRLTLKVP